MADPNSGVLNNILSTLLLATFCATASVGAVKIYTDTIREVEAEEARLNPPLKIAVIDMASIVRDQIGIEGDQQTIQRRATEIMLQLKAKSEALINQGYIILDDSVVVDAPSHLRITLD